MNLNPSELLYFLSGAGGVLMYGVFEVAILFELAKFLLLSPRRPLPRVYVFIATILVGTLFGAGGSLFYVQAHPDTSEPLSAVIGGIVAVGTLIGWLAYALVKLPPSSSLRLRR